MKILLKEKLLVPLIFLFLSLLSIIGMFIFNIYREVLYHPTVFWYGALAMLLLTGIVLFIVIRKVILGQNELLEHRMNKF